MSESVLRPGHVAVARLAQAGQTPAHIVSTSSIAGLWSGLPFIGPYAVSKVGVVSLSETLRDELRAEGGPIGISVLIPSSVGTHASARATLEARFASILADVPGE